MELALHSGLARTLTSTSTNSSPHTRMNSTGGPNTLMNSHAHQSYASQYSNSSFGRSTTRDTQSSQSTQSTAATSSTTLFNTPHLYNSSTPVNGGPVEVADNVLNKRGGADTSLFQICIHLRQRLRAIPGFDSYLIEEENNADADADPVTLLWRTFRRGYPLMDVYNALSPKVRLSIDEGKIGEKNRPRAAAYKFLQACVTELKFPSEECFIISDLYSDDTTGFVKVVKVVNRVLDILVQLRIIGTEDQASDSASTTSTIKRTQREHIIDELVKTERTYVQHLELLQQFKSLVEEKGVITGDNVHDIFLNLNALLDFQRRFLIRVEQTNQQPPEEQNWGNLFVLYKDAFKVYETFIANQKKCEETAMREFDKLKETGGSPEMQQMVQSATTLTAFLLKPFQRLTKYPLLLEQLRKQGDLDEQRKQDITRGIEAASSVLERSNAAIARAERQEAVEELKNLVEDWKGHRIEGFGDLLLHGQFTVLKGDTVNSKNEEREYKIYLFEMILLCCKEINPNKQKNRVMNKPSLGRNGKNKLQLKGRIFMQNVTETISLQKPGSYTCQIFWKGDPGIENFIIRFNSEETMKKWANQVDQQRRIWKDAARASSRSQPSNTEFNSIRDLNLENPYKEDDDDLEDNEDMDTVVPGYQDNYGIRSNGSQVSLRSRSTTGDSGPPVNDMESRVPPPRFPIGYSPQAALTLRTQQLANAGGPPESYFSPTPTVDSPMSSSRTSSSSTGMFPFPRQQPPTSGWHGEDNNRFTAPAMGARQMSRDGPRSMQRPSLPPGAGSSLMQNRMRSASSPDIHNPNGPRRSTGQQTPVPDVPPFPTHYAHIPGIVNRSNSNSPSSLPPRAATQSPAVQRERLAQQVQQRTAAELANSDYIGGPARRDPNHVPMPRTMTPASSFERSQGTLTPASVDSRMSPPMGTQNEGPQIPTQLKVKVHCPSAGSSMTLVVSTNISFQSLKDRIDAKLQRSTSVSLGAGQVKLKYLDDNDYVSIQSDEDVQTAFETWKEQQRDMNPGGGQLGEIELFCQR